MGKTYFDKREGREKTIPNCASHGLVWNPESQRCEKIRGLGFMAEDFYTDDYYDGDFYSGSYGADVYLNGSGGGGYDTGLYLPPDYFQGTDIPYAPVDLVPLEPPSFELVPTFEEYYGLPYVEPISGGNYFEDYLDYYLDLGYDPLTAVDLATQDASQQSIVAETTYAPMPLPDISPLPTIPYVTPYVPTFWAGFPEGDYFPLPLPPEPPGTDLPPYCPGGYYHPINDPFACVPFPTTATTQQQRPPTQRPSQPPAQAPRPPASQAPRPPTQQQPCPTGYCKHPTTGQCMPIPRGYQRHPQTQVCTPLTAQVSPLPIPTEAQDMFADLKKLPWWVWLALGGVVLLGMGGGEKKSVTVSHRRAS